ncbi:MAG: tetratricopeptide repeat-containing diguanylate cyclase [Pseudomonadota bacterium]
MASAQGLDASAVFADIRDAHRRGDLVQAETLALDALDSIGLQSDPVLKGRLLTSLAGIHISQNNYQSAESLLDRAQTVLAEHTDTAAFAGTLHQLARLNRYRADYSDALGLLRRSRLIYESLDDLAGLEATYNLNGVITRFLGQLEQSLEWHSRSLALARETGNQTAVASALYNIASIHESLGEFGKARDYYVDVLKLDEERGNPRDVSFTSLRIGMSLIELAEYDEARVHIQRALDLLAPVNMPRDYQWAVATLARLDAAEGKSDMARAELENVLALALGGSWPVLTNRARHWLAELEFNDGHLDASLAHIQLALDDALEQESLQRVLALYNLQVQVLETAGRPEAALRALRKHNALKNDLSDSLRTSVLAAMESEADFRHQSVALQLAREQRAVTQMALERETTRRAIGFGLLIAAFGASFLAYGRIMTQRQNRLLVQEVAQKTQALREQHDELARAYDAVEQASVTDPLTGLANRRFLERHIDADVGRAIRMWSDDADATPAEADLVFFLVDLDYFKAINDQHGHAAGDAVLVQVSQLLGTVFRDADIKARWGGEEFLVIARFVTRDQASIIAERLREALAAHAFGLSDGQSIHCTCSIGFAAFPLCRARPGAVAWETVVELADEALYLAKASGRNGWAGYLSAAQPPPEGPVFEWVNDAIRQNTLVRVQGNEFSAS